MRLATLSLESGCPSGKPTNRRASRIDDLDIDAESYEEVRAISDELEETLSDLEV